VSFYTGEGKDRVSSIVNGVRTGSLPVLAVSYSDNGFLRPLYRSFAVLIYLFLVMAFLMIVVLKWGAQRIYIPVCIFLGILYMLVIPVYSVPDEYAHIDTSYSLSNRLLGIPRPEGMDGYDYRREIDVETEEYFTYNTSMDDYARLYKELQSVVQDQELTPCVMRATDSNVNLLYFLPTAGMGLLSHRKNGLLDKQVIRRAVPVGLPLAAAPARLANAADISVLRKPFGVFLLFVGVTTLWQTKAQKK
jgi:uncharacterized membrane protein YfcA